MSLDDHAVMEVFARLEETETRLATLEAALHTLSAVCDSVGNPNFPGVQSWRLPYREIHAKLSAAGFPSLPVGEVAGVLSQLLALGATPQSMPVNRRIRATLNYLLDGCEVLRSPESPTGHTD